MRKRKRTRKEERLIALIKKHKEVKIRVINREFTEVRERIIKDNGDAEFACGENDGRDGIGWRQPCWSGHESLVFQGYLKRGLRRTVRSMLAHDHRWMKIEAIFIGPNLDKKLKVKL